MKTRILVLVAMAAAAAGGHSFVPAPGRAYKLLAENELGETVMATHAISDSVLYILGGKHLFAISVRP